MLTATMAAFGWLNIIICINFAGCGRADTVWIAQLEHDHHLGKGASIGSGAATESIDVCGCATLLSKSEAWTIEFHPYTVWDLLVSTGEDRTGAT